MTNKIPEVGKRYESSSFGIVEFLGTYSGLWIFRPLNYNKGWAPEKLIAISDPSFWNHYKELPETKEEPKSQQSDEVQVALEELKNFIEESRELHFTETKLEGYLIDKRLADIKLRHQFQVNLFHKKAQNLIDALEKQEIWQKGQKAVDTVVKSFSESERKKVYNEGFADGFEKAVEKPKSIWKPVSELPEWPEQIIVEYSNRLHYAFLIWVDGELKVRVFSDNAVGTFYKDIIPERFCTLTDFITEHESLKTRIEKLEKIIKEKE